MKLNKNYEFVVKTKEENAELIDLLTSAEGKLSEALGHITYTEFPDVNKGIILSIQDIIGNISRLEYNINAGHMELLKPVKSSSKEMNYYELQYFYDRKDNGSIYIETDIDLDSDCSGDEDVFLAKLVNKNFIAAATCSKCSKITKISKKEYDEKYSEPLNLRYCIMCNILGSRVYLSWDNTSNRYCVVCSKDELFNSLESNTDEHPFLFTNKEDAKRIIELHAKEFSGNVHYVVSLNEMEDFEGDEFFKRVF